MIEWPEALLTELAERRCAIVVGAGVSASATNAKNERPPGWEAFLKSGIEKIRSKSQRQAAEQLLGEGSYLDAAQVIYDSLEQADYSKFVRESFELLDYSPSRVHELLLEIDPKIFITTNYDNLLERPVGSGPAKKAYNVARYYDSHIVNDLRSDRRMIIKAHGCVSDPHRAVLTRRQYFDARRNCPQFFAVLDAIFLTNTLLFIGSGFNGDPDMELLLQNAQIAAPSEHQHYAVIPEGRNESVLKALGATYNVKFLTYPRGQHEVLVSALEELSLSVDASRSIPS